MRPRPIDHLEAVSRDYPGVWRDYDNMLAGRGRDLPDWPSWCFAPLAAAYAVVSGGGEVEFRKLPDIGRVGALAAWRPTQGIYRFDPTLLDELRATPVTGDLPVEHLQRLPEWCVYVELPRETWGMHGFFAHLESDANDARPELRLLLDFDDGLLSIPLHLVGSIPRAIDAALAEAVSNGLSYIAPGTTESLTKKLAPLVSVLLYLCSEDAEMRPTRGRGTVRPAMKPTKDGPPRMPPAKALEVWETGFRLGAALREAIARSEEEGGASVRPHVRRAHWHSYWRGEGRSERIVKWLSPILVGGGPEKATVRDVREP